MREREWDTEREKQRDGKKDIWKDREVLNKWRNCQREKKRNQGMNEIQKKSKKWKIVCVWQVVREWQRQRKKKKERRRYEGTLGVIQIIRDTRREGGHRSVTHTFFAF